MSNLNGRINKLEQTVESQGPEKGILHLFQSLEDDNLFHGRDVGQGTRYHRSQFEVLSEQYRLVVITYTKNWRPRKDDHEQP